MKHLRKFNESATGALVGSTLMILWLMFLRKTVKNIAINNIKDAIASKRDQYTLDVSESEDQYLLIFKAVDRGCSKIDMNVQVLKNEPRISLSVPNQSRSGSNVPTLTFIDVDPTFHQQLIDLVK